MAWTIRDMLRAVYSTGVVAVAGDPGKLVLGVDPAGTYQPIAVAAGGAIVAVAGISTFATYQCAFTVASAIGHAFEILPSATKTVNILEMYLSKPTVATVVTLLKQSIADTVGTSTNAVDVPLDSADAAGTAVVKMYTVAPTPGTLTGNLFIDSMATTDRIDFNAGNGIDKPIVLKKNTTQSLALNISVACTLTVFLKWVETT